MESRLHLRLKFGQTYTLHCGTNLDILQHISELCIYGTIYSHAALVTKEYSPEVYTFATGEKDDMAPIVAGFVVGGVVAIALLVGLIIATMVAVRRLQLNSTPGKYIPDILCIQVAV